MELFFASGLIPTGHPVELITIYFIRPLGYKCNIFCAIFFIWELGILFYGINGHFWTKMARIIIIQSNCANWFKLKVDMVLLKSGFLFLFSTVLRAALSNVHFEINTLIRHSRR